MQLAIYDPEDDLFAHLLTRSARRRGHVARQVEGIDEIPSVFSTPPSAVIVGVPDLDQRGVESVGRVRASNSSALIYVAAEQARSQQVILALEQGATEVIRKPFLPGEIIKRAEIAASHRGALSYPDSSVRVSDLVVELDQSVATKAGNVLALTRMELRLLYCLVEHRGRVAPSNRLLAFASQSDEFATSGLKTHMSHLRQKLNEAGGEPATLQAHQMLGYALVIPGPK